MKQPCEKCYNLRTTLSWSARPVLTEYGSGYISLADRIIYSDFYKDNDDPNAWPVCPNCGERVPADEPENETGEPFDLPLINLAPARLFLGLLFLAFLIAVLLF